MFLSVFDIFKVGIGPSSSHTMGPMAAAGAFLDLLSERRRELPPLAAWLRIRVSLHGSLAFTGKGHATDRAVILGLLGHRAADLDVDRAEADLATLGACGCLPSDSGLTLVFDPDEDIVFDRGPPLPGHPNGLTFQAIDQSGAARLSQIYYSTGGGFIVTAEELASGADGKGDNRDLRLPFPFDTVASMLQMASESGKTIAEMKRTNERVLLSDGELDSGLWTIWAAMSECMNRGLTAHGELPGGLHVKRRAGALFAQLCRERGTNRVQPHVVSDWLNVYAMAVNEENAGGGKVVTAPTNGAAGVIPAVLRYYLDHCVGAADDRVAAFLLTAAAIGGPHQAQRVDLRRRRWLPSGGRLGRRHGRGRSVCRSRRSPRTGGERGRDRPRAPPRHDLRPRRGTRPGALHRAKRYRREQGGGGRVARPSRRRQPFHATRQLHRRDVETGQEMSTRLKETSLGGLAVNLPQC